MSTLYGKVLHVNLNSIGGWPRLGIAKLGMGLVSGEFYPNSLGMLQTKAQFCTKGKTIHHISAHFIYL